MPAVFVDAKSPRGTRREVIDAEGHGVLTGRTVGVWGELTAGDISPKVDIRRDHWPSQHPADQIQDGILKESRESLLI